MEIRAQEPESTMSRLVGALLEELAHEIPEDTRLEGVRADLLAASASYEHGNKKDLALRFYLAIHSLLFEFERLSKAGSSKAKDATAGGSGPSQSAPHAAE